MTHLDKGQLNSHLILWISALIIILALIWANFAVLDEVTSGEGKVIPSSQIQIIQNLEGGIVEKIYVHEGDRVEKGQVLIKINDVRFIAEYNSKLKKSYSLKLEILRLTDLMNDLPYDIPDNLQTDKQEVAAQKALYKSKKNELTQMNLQLKNIQKEFSLTEPLVAKGAASQVEVLQLRRLMDELQGKIYNYKSTFLERLNAAKGELSTLTAANNADEDRVLRTTVTSPVKGIVKKINTNTVGGVIQPGSDILEIVPLDDTLLIEAKIKPRDIGFIHPGQDATVKLTAFDFSIYGDLDGKVEQISADTITDEKLQKEESYYLIRIRTTKNHLGTEAKPLYIIPGMLATVDILTGKKTVMDYLLKPILKARNLGLRER